MRKVVRPSIVAAWLGRAVALCLVHPLHAQAWQTDVSKYFSQPGLFGRQPQLQFANKDTIALSFDQLSRCDEHRSANMFTVLLLDARRGTVINQRSFSARPDSLRLVSLPDGGLVTVSRHSINVLDSSTLEIKRSIRLTLDTVQRDSAATDPTSDANCSFLPFEVSATPDRSRIEVRVPSLSSTAVAAYQINGRTLEVSQEEMPRRQGDFEAGYDADYVHSSRRQWTRSENAASVPICDVCDKMKVLTANELVVADGARFSILRDGLPVWSPHVSGMLDGIATDKRGDRFAALIAVPKTIFSQVYAMQTIVFDVAQRRMTALPKLNPPPKSEEGFDTAIALSDEGERVAILVGEKLISYPVGSK